MTKGDTYINTYEHSPLPVGALVTIEDVSLGRVYYSYYVSISYLLKDDRSAVRYETRDEVISEELFLKRFTKYVYK